MAKKKNRIIDNEQLRVQRVRAAIHRKRLIKNCRDKINLSKNLLINLNTNELCWLLEKTEKRKKTHGRII